MTQGACPNLAPYRIRTFSPEDLPALVEIHGSAAKADQQDFLPTLEELRQHFESPGYRAENCYVASLANGEVVAYGDAFSRGKGGMAVGTGAVRPDHRRRGLGARLVDLADSAHRERRGSLPADEPRYVRRTVPAGVGGVEELFVAQGYRPVRRHFNLTIALDRPMPPTALPDGFALQPFARERDGRAVYECRVEAFRDHWGASTPAPYEVWEASHFSDPTHDPGLWLVAVHSNEVVGVCLGTGYSVRTPHRGWVNTLGVRSAWRKQGLASALLSLGLHVFQTKDFTRVDLLVDGENRTGALALYKRAGMRVAKTVVTYRKVLSGREDLIKD